jgi:uncharacterized protein (TIGR02246 family)
MTAFSQRFGSALLVVMALALAPKLAAQVPATADSTTVPAAVRAMIDSVNAAWIPQLQRKDAAGIAAPYADDGMLVDPTGETYRGRAAVEEAMRTSLARLGTTQVGGRLVQDGITRVGTLIYEWGHADLEISVPGRPTAHSAGRYLTVWQQDPTGRWRILRNLSLP